MLSPTLVVEPSVRSDRRTSSRFERAVPWRPRASKSALRRNMTRGGTAGLVAVRRSASRAPWLDAGPARDDRPSKTCERGSHVRASGRASWADRSSSSSVRASLVQRRRSGSDNTRRAGILASLTRCLPRGYPSHSASGFYRRRRRSVKPSEAPRRIHCRLGMAAATLPRPTNAGDPRIAVRAPRGRPVRFQWRSQFGWETAIDGCEAGVACRPR